jgi:glycine dehydrogenase subunit 2
MLLPEPLIFERGSPGRAGWTVPRAEDDDAVAPLPRELVRGELDGFPEVSEPDVVRHFTRLSQWNYSAATTLYPLGSCTMKHNPFLNEAVARLPGFTALHPLVPAAWAQGAMRLCHDLAHWLCEISGMDAVSLQPAAGAQGELTGMLMIRAFLADRGNPRSKVLIPASAHGTNPASSALCGYRVVEVPVGDGGLLEARAVEQLMDADVAALMVTNPNTLGAFEEEIVEIADAVHAKGGLVYMDGANLNALMGVAKPATMGADVIQFNLHKTFSTPHGGGGPGAGPVGVGRDLEPYLPVPRLRQIGDRFEWSEESPKSIGQVRSFFGNFGVLVRAYAYMLSMGGEGLSWATRMAVLNANYVRARLRSAYDLPLPTPSMHECVFSDRRMAASGVRTLDIAKRLLDYGFYAPTIYFPLVVSGALMIEPTETESRETLDAFTDALIAIAEETRTNPQLVKDAPHHTKVRRLDETRAARRPELAWRPSP